MSVGFKLLWFERERERERERMGFGKMAEIR